MAAPCSSISPLLLSLSTFHPHPHLQLSSPFLSPPSLQSQFHPIKPFHILQSSRRSTSTSHLEDDDSRNENRYWNRFDFDGYEEDDDEDDEDDDDDDRSLDLFVRFVENIFRKVSKRARKAVRSVLPVAISTKLVGFAVNGMIVLSFLWVLKAFLEVVCTLGSFVFVSILLIRGVWSGVLYLQENRARHLNGFDDDQPPWTGAQPVT